MRSLLLLTAVIVATSFTLSAQNTSVQEYIDQYKDIAINEQVRTGVPASITLAQGILESGSGNSRLAKYSNNHFGIKCKKEWTGATVYQDDDTKNECFRVYPTARDSYRDHSDFLRNRPYYTSLFDLDPKDYKSWAKGLKKAGYAMERDYPQNLIGLIEKYNLEQYSDEALAIIKRGGNASDNMASVNSPATNGADKNSQAYDTDNNKQNLALFNDSGEKLATTDKPSQDALASNDNGAEHSGSASDNYTVSKNTCTLSPDAYPSGVFKINNTKVVYVSKGSSLFALASNQHMSYNKLLSYNGLESGTDILLKDRLVFLEKKPKKGERDVHVVANGETLDEVAQKEGVQLNSLALYNHIETAAVPLPGENLYLRNASPSAPRLAGGNTLALNN